MRGSCSWRSPKRRGPSRSASTSRSVQRSPTLSSAAASGEVGSVMAESYSVYSHLQFASHCPGARMNAIGTIQDTIASAAETVGPAVVGLGRGWGHGSGVVVAEGRVLTSAHNLRREEVTVIFADGRREAGTVAGVDSDLDLAVLAVDTADAPAVSWEPGEPLGI